jgi:hypothetical protein
MALMLLQYLAWKHTHQLIEHKKVSVVGKYIIEEY